MLMKDMWQWNYTAKMVWAMGGKKYKAKSWKLQVRNNWKAESKQAKSFSSRLKAENQ